MIETVVKGTATRRRPRTTTTSTGGRCAPRNIYGKAQEWNEVPIRTFQRALARGSAAAEPGGQPDPVGDDLLLPVDAGPPRNALPARHRHRPELLHPTPTTSCFTTETTYTPGYVEPPLDKCMPVPGADLLLAGAGVSTSRRRRSTASSPRSRRLRLQPPAGHAAHLLERRDRGRARPSRGRRQDAVEYEDQGDLDRRRQDRRSPVAVLDADGTALDPARVPSPGRCRRSTRTSTCSPALFGGRTDLTGEMPTPTGADPLTRPHRRRRSVATTRFPALTWEPVDGAAYYRLYVGRRRRALSSRPRDDVPLPGGDRHSASHPDSRELRLVRVGLRADDACIGSPGAMRTFTIQVLARRHRSAGRPRRLRPRPGTACDRPRRPAEPRALRQHARAPRCWTGARARRRSTTWSTCRGTRSSPTWCSATSRALDHPATVEHPGGLRRWPCPTARPATPTTGSSARARPKAHARRGPTEATHAFDKRSNRVQRTSPAERVGTAANDVTFTWKDYLDTNQHSARQPDDRREAAGRQGYRIQVSHDLGLQHAGRRGDCRPDDVHRLQQDLPRGQALLAGPGGRRPGNGLAWSTRGPSPSSPSTVSSRPP